MKKITYQTEYTKIHNVKLVILTYDYYGMTYCHGYDVDTNKRRKDFDGFYYRKELSK